jgi:hypothetical protein
MDWFGNYVQRFEWRKERELPDWAKRIFSQHMVAAGNVQDESELEQIVQMAKDTLSHYLETVAETNNTATDTSSYQNHYCDNQKQNPHTPRVMASLGLNEQDIAVFIDKCLFPEIR